jgi:hypothetical protein
MTHPAPDKQKRPGSCQTARLDDDRSLVRDRDVLRLRAVPAVDAPVPSIGNSSLYPIPLPAATSGSNPRDQRSLTAVPHCGVGVPGLEPGTSVLSGLRSNQLS